jgi:uncharacterized protein (DUF2126 family)
LVFEVVDTWNRHSLGGFTYHVTHPGGRAYDRFPVNAAEAEARRAGRFQPEGSTSGRRPPRTGQAASAPCPEQGQTLDLRRFRPASR